MMEGSSRVGSVELTLIMQELLREYPMHEITGFTTDVGIGVFYFTWRPTPSHPGEHIHLFSKKYVRYLGLLPVPTVVS